MDPQFQIINMLKIPQCDRRTKIVKDDIFLHLIKVNNKFNIKCKMINKYFSKICIKTFLCSQNTNQLLILKIVAHHHIIKEINNNQVGTT